MTHWLWGTTWAPAVEAIATNTLLRDWYSMGTAAPVFNCQVTNIYQAVPTILISWPARVQAACWCDVVGGWRPRLLTALDSIGRALWCLICVAACYMNVPLKLWGATSSAIFNWNYTMNIILGTNTIIAKRFLSRGEEMACFSCTWNLTMCNTAIHKDSRYQEYFECKLQHSVVSCQKSWFLVVDLFNTVLVFSVLLAGIAFL